MEVDFTTGTVELPPTLLSQLAATAPDVLKWIESVRAENKHYAAIGRVAAAWSYFEALVDTASIELAKLDAKIGVCFTAQIAGIGRKLDAYISLARLSRDLPQKLIGEFDKYAKSTASLAERRNRTVHDVWFFDHPNPPQRLEATAKKLLRIEFIPATPEELVKLSVKISEHADEFTALTNQVDAAPRTSPETPPVESGR